MLLPGEQEDVIMRRIDLSQFFMRLNLELLYRFRVFVTGDRSLHPKEAELRDIDATIDGALSSAETDLRHTVQTFLFDSGLDRDPWIEASLDLQVARARLLAEAARAAHHERVRKKYAWF